MSEVGLLQLDPGHFHAALIQKEMYPGVSARVEVYAPVGPDAADYLTRVAQFNTRRQSPTAWELELHLGGDCLARLTCERAGNVAVIAGRNRPKMERIRACVNAGLHVLADKPWIIASRDMPELEATLEEAERRGLVAYDIMTERYEITSILQRILANDADIFGEPVPGSANEPAVTARSVHHLMKLVAGQPVRRPAWFFDVEEYGEGLADVGTHVVDLVEWTLFPDRLLDYWSDVELLTASRWPTVLSEDQFRKVTGDVRSGPLEYFCNNTVLYKLCGVHVALDIRWNWEAPPGGGDVYEASFRGTHAVVEIRQGERERYRPELYVTPASEVLRRRVSALEAEFPGLGLEENSGVARLIIPDRFRVGHEAHFAQVTRQFFGYLDSPGSMPPWEKANMLMKYFISTKGTELSRNK